ncbi:hypothetical protein [Caudoviricetes sp.]|nr:hypothetical protein [Caudoviricetes sp.]UOF81127.1 hypothetical protein [Caudoviricetes sp.]UOF82237.1 hypothetical protein [Caudoviricetes sp.]UOF82472.1 hypothetical protein [Caudoviricetes sp.]UOF82626.1 hypothetical protein [Caudoviricetes sp.]
MTPKPFYLSKTVWLNVITTLVAALTFLPSVSGLIPDVALPYILGVVGVLNVILRVWFTETPVSH